ncbi:MAG: pyridoxal-phosphate dependent enzyme [Bacteroidota bacterium]
MLPTLSPSPLQRLSLPVAEAQRVTLYCKRDDLYTPAPGTALQGNKVRKLGGVLQAAASYSRPPILVSFGGAYSNHLSALATAGRLYNLPVVIFVRGEEVDNPILRRARMDGAQLILIARADYRLKEDKFWLKTQRQQLATSLQRPPEDIWFIPEGGTCPGSARSVGQLYAEVVTDLGEAPDYLCISAGTGGSAAGIIQAASPSTMVEVYPALKGNWMQQTIKQLLPTKIEASWQLITDYHFGGYGKFPKAWIVDSPGLAKRANIGQAHLPPLEPIYTAKLFSGVLDRITRGCYPPGCSVVIIHTGGIY